MLAISWGVRKARIWLNEVPEWYYDTTDVVERIEQITNTMSTQLSCAALELSVPTGGMIYYGGIAVTFVPASEEKLIIRVPILNKGAAYTESLVSKVDNVYTGFPREYAKGFLDSIVQPPSLSLIGQGLFQVCGAVHGQVGSSPWIFGVLGRSLVKLLSLPGTDVSEKRLIEIIHTEIR